MQRTAFPRLYVPPEEVLELSPVPAAFFRGTRSAFGPVTVFSVAETREVVSHKDWCGEEAIDLARALLSDISLPRDDPEQHEAFAREVLAHLPADSWELPKADVRKWQSRWHAREEEASCNYPPPSDPESELPGPADEARMLELVKKIGGKDDERGTVD